MATRISRRAFVAGLLASSVPVGGALAQMWIPYDGKILLPGPLATCDRLRALIADAKLFRESLRTDAVVDLLIQKHIETAKSLEKDLQATRSAIESKDKSLLLQRVAVVAGVVLTAAGFIVTSPFAVGALLGLQIVGGTTIVALQAIYEKSSAPSVVFSYSKDRVLVLGEPVADAIGSSGGKMSLRVLGVVSLLVDMMKINSDTGDLEQLQLKASLLADEAERYRQLLKKFPAKSRGPWRAMFETSVSGTIASLQRVVDQYADNNCIIPIVTGPTLKST